MSESTKNLQKSLSISGAVALAFGIVVGAGLLSLPGMAYTEARGSALYAWAIDAIAVVPLLAVFSYLGSRYPSAGGIAGFLHTSHGRHVGRASEVLLMGTFGLGIPAIASIGGHYLAYAMGVGQIAAGLFAIGIIMTCGVINFFGASLSSGFQQVVTYGLIACLGTIAVVGMFYGLAGYGDIGATGVAAPSSMLNAVPVLGLVFFAYTGWEMLSFTTEEFRNPRRDYPIAVAISFVLIIGMYLALALAVQLSLAPNHPGVENATIAALTSAMVGPIGGKFIAFLGFVAIVANVNGALWAASRLVFSSSRAGLLPARISAISEKRGHPAAAVVLTTMAFCAVLLVTYASGISTKSLLGIAGQNFFILYFMSVLAFTKLTSSVILRAFSYVGMIGCVVFALTFGLSLLYPLALLLVGYVLSRYLIRRGGVSAKQPAIRPI